MVKIPLEVLQQNEIKKETSIACLLFSMFTGFLQKDNRGLTLCKGVWFMIKTEALHPQAEKSRQAMSFLPEMS
jgi:hypothetical protein